MKGASIPDYRFPDASWSDDAACLSEPVKDIFFPNRGDLDSIRDAKFVCAGCPVLHACLSWALGNNIEHGIWGMATEKERRAMKKRAVA